MKEINIFIDSKDLSRVTNILLSHKLGVTFFDIQGTGRTPKYTPEYIESYQTGRSIIPRFIGKTLVISIVSDNIYNDVVTEIANSFTKDNEPKGMIFVKDVSNALELGTTLNGDEILISQ